MKLSRTLFNEALDDLVADGVVEVTHEQGCLGPARDYRCCETILTLNEEKAAIWEAMLEKPDDPTQIH